MSPTTTQRPGPLLRAKPLRASFALSFGFILGMMFLAGVAQHLYLEVLVPRGVHDQPWFPYLVGAWGVAFVVGVGLYGRRLYQLLASVRTSVAILSIFAACCVLGSFVLQKRDLDSRGLKGEKAYEAFRLAEAGFLHYMMKGQRYEQPMSENGEAYFATLRKRFGDKYADERVELFHKMMGGRTKDAEIKEFADDYDAYFRKLWDFCRLTRLYDIHRSWAFITLMALLSASLLAGTWKRFVWRAEQTGFFSTHLGFVVLMVGFTLSMAGERRGILPLEVGRTLDEIWEFNTNKPLKLPMRVTLEDFYTERHHELFTEFLDVDYRARGFPGPIQRGLKPHGGSRYELSGGEYKIEVLDNSEYGAATPDVIERPDGAPQPAVQIDVSSPDGAGASGYLFAGHGSQSTYEDPTGRFLLAFHADEEAAMQPPVPDRWGQLLLQTEGAAPELVEVRPGAAWTYAGKRFKVAQVAADFAERDKPLKSQQVKNPAVRLEITEGDGEPAERWSFAWIDFDKMHEPAFSEIRLQYRFRAGNLDPRKVVHLHARGGELEWIRFDRDGEPTVRPLPLGEAVPLGIEDFSVQVDRSFRRAARVFVVDPIFERDLLARDRRDAARRLEGGASPASQAASAPEPSGAAGSTSAAAGEAAGSGSAAGETGPPGEADEHAGHDHAPGEGHGRAPVSAELKAAQTLLGPVDPATHRRFHPPGPPAAKLKITHPGGVVERWFLSGHPEAGAWSDGVMQIRFAANPNKVKEWRSMLIATDGRQVERKVVRVNTTFDFAGWTMYQTDADPKRPNYSGIQVLKDPGWYLIEPGLIMVCFGVIFMFWIKPWMRMDQSGGSRARRRKAAQS